jgi:hypothetical protein
MCTTDAHPLNCPSRHHKDSRHVVIDVSGAVLDKADSLLGPLQSEPVGLYSGGPSVFLTEQSTDPPTTTVKGLAAKHAYYGFNFVPLVTSELQLSCWIDILFYDATPPAACFSMAI